MTKAALYELSSIKSSARDMEELNKIQRVEEIYKDQVLDKLSSIGVISAKVDKIYQEIIKEKYGKH